MTWSKTWAGKNTQYQELLARTQRALAGSSTVVLHSTYEPVQAQWEAAYVSQVQQNLPIEPGCRLLWYDIRNGNMSLYTTTLDLNDNTSTSGIVYPALSKHSGRDALSTMGSPHQTGFLSNTIIKSNTVHANFMLDRTSFGRKGITLLKGFASYRFGNGLTNSKIANITIYFTAPSDNPYNVSPSAELDMRGWNTRLTAPTLGAVPTLAYNVQEDIDISVPMEILSSNTQNLYGMGIMFEIALAYDEAQGAKWMNMSGKIALKHDDADGLSVSHFGMVRRSGYTFGEQMEIFANDSGGAERIELIGRGSIIAVGGQGFVGKEFGGE